MRRAPPRCTGVLIALATAAVLAGCGGPPPTASTGQARAGVEALLRGVEQRNVSLGAEDAPDVLIVYSDPDSLRYDGFSEQVLPQLVQRYVRPGNLVIKLAPVDAEPVPTRPAPKHSAAQDLLAASVQDRLWTFALLYERMGVGSYDPTLGQAVARQVRGLDVAAFNEAAASPRIRAAVAKYARRFRRRPGDLPQLRLDPEGNADRDVEVLDLARLKPGTLLARIETTFGYTPE